jgi:hypothetical protein
MTGNQKPDSEAIRDVLHAYCRMLDTRELDGMLDQVYAADAVDDRRRGSPRRGLEEIRAYFEQSFPLLEATAHLLTNIEVHVDGDRARSYSRVLACHWFAANELMGKARPSECVLVGSYTDQLHRFSEGWRIVHREVDVLGPAGLLAGALPLAFRGFGGIQS